MSLDWCDTLLLKEPKGLRLERLVGPSGRHLPLADAVAFGAAPWVSRDAIANLSTGLLSPEMLDMMADAIEGIALPSLEKLSFAVDGDAERWSPGSASAGRLLEFARCGAAQSSHHHPFEAIRAVLHGPDCWKPGSLGRVVRAGAMLQARVAATDRGEPSPSENISPDPCLA